jgi:tRNA nucleotidyltransferase (CCA-adding enzyme)
VRDRTLGRKSVDIDIVVEGNAIKAAKELNKRLKGKLSIYKEFGTASIHTKNEDVDLASARIEKYRMPAVLPHVYPSTIIQDLNRRDFTINAIAMSISKDNFGEIIDPFSGLVDIKKGIIRVLHKDSFVDDPTRVFRALRYKNRFSFRLEKKTKALLKEAIAKKLINRLTGQRILNEIRLIFNEETYLKTLEDVSDNSIFKIKKSDLELLPLLGSQKIYFYMSIIDTNKFPLTREEKKIIADFKKLGKTVARLAKATKNSTIYTILSSLADEVVNVILTTNPELNDKIKLYSVLRRKKPYVDGNDLNRLRFRPKTRFKTVLKKLFDLQLDKEIKSKKEALQYFKKLKIKK